MNTLLNLSSGAVTITIPLNITVSLGTPDTAAQTVGEQIPPDGRLEKIEIDPDYENRPGYNSDFLGFPAPLPTLMPSIRSLAVEVTNNGRADRYELKYHHYSVIMNRERRLAFVAAVNFDAHARFEYERQGRDKWFLDSRIAEAFQTNEDLYADNPFDRGHLVRRADAAWGDSEAEAKLANDDTFHFTNCSPQHEIFNQSSVATKRNLRLWGNLENHITEEARSNNKKLCIFNGPVFHPDDKSYRGIPIPREFWKVVVFEKENGDSCALAFLLSQATLIKDLPEEEFEVGVFHTSQIKISELEEITQLNFGVLRSYDPLEDETNENVLEAGTKVVLTRLKDILL